MDFLLRPWRREDAADIAPLANNRAVADNLRDIFPYPYTLQNAQDFVAMCIAMAEFLIPIALVLIGLFALLIYLLQKFWLHV